jgi:glycerol-3-phosphate O-acyltransferase
LGSAVQAFSRNQARGITRPVYVVPTTINYALVLEAETLIEDWLKERGQARYIIEDDEFSRIERWAAFFRKIVGLSSACVIRFGDPLDPFGNRVDDEGRSLAPNGNVIDPRTYTLRDGKSVEDPARDAAYTQELGEILVARYREESVIMATQIVAHVLFRRLVEKTPNRDLYARIRMRGEVAIPLSSVYAAVGAVRDALLSAMHRGEVRVSTFARAETPERLVARALEIWSGYHERTAAHVERGNVVIDEPMLLLYYQNRLTPFAEMVASEQTRAAATEIFAMGDAR